MADYQFQMKKTHADSKAIDNYYPINRSEDVKLSKVSNIEDSSLPQVGDNLTDSINKYNKRMQQTDEAIGDIMSDYEEMEEVVESSKQEIESHSESISSLTSRADAVETNVSNLGNNVTNLGMSVAELTTDVSDNEKKIQTVSDKASLNEKDITEIKEQIESGIGSSDMQEVTYDQIAALFSDDDITVDEDGTTKVIMVEVTYEQIAALFKQNDNEE